MFVIEIVASWVGSEVEDASGLLAKTETLTEEEPALIESITFDIVAGYR